MQVWMRTATLTTVWKLYRKIDNDLKAGVYTLDIDLRYPVRYVCVCVCVCVFVAHMRMPQDGRLYIQDIYMYINYTCICINLSCTSGCLCMYVCVYVYVHIHESFG
jgi:hypothetical protein